jgi:serine/threonine protein kinase
MNKEHLLVDSHDIHEFLHYLKTQKDLLVKTYKTNFLLTGSRRQDNFNVELAENKRILSVYGSKAKAYLTLYPITGFRSYTLLGASLHLHEANDFYMIFGHRCQNKFSIEPNHMLRDLLKSLEILQKARYLHNDIKLENIVLCDNTYKFIDWGQAGSFNQLHMGDMIGTSPVKWHLMGFSELYTDHIMALRTQMVNSDFRFSQLFDEVQQQIHNEYQEIVASSPSFKSLVRTYTDTFDVFMLGMVLLRAIHKYGLDTIKWLPLVKALVSLKKPLNAKEALKLL